MVTIVSCWVHSFTSITALRIPGLVAEKYGTIQAETLKTIEKRIKESGSVVKALTALSGGTLSAAPTSTAPTGTPNRTLASPDWNGEALPNFRSTIEIAGISIAEFQNQNTLPSTD